MSKEQAERGGLAVTRRSRGSHVSASASMPTQCYAL